MKCCVEVKFIKINKKIEKKILPGIGDKGYSIFKQMPSKVTPCERHGAKAEYISPN